MVFPDFPLTREESKDFIKLKYCGDVFKGCLPTFGGTSDMMKSQSLWFSAFSALPIMMFCQ